MVGGKVSTVSTVNWISMNVRISKPYMVVIDMIWVVFSSSKQSGPQRNRSSDLRLCARARLAPENRFQKLLPKTQQGFSGSYNNNNNNGQHLTFVEDFPASLCTYPGTQGFSGATPEFLTWFLVIEWFLSFVSYANLAWISPDKSEQWLSLIKRTRGNHVL